MADFLDYAKSLSPVIVCPFYLGHALNISGNGLVPSYVNAAGARLVFVGGPKGFALVSDNPSAVTADYLSVGSSALLDSTQGTLLCFGKLGHPGPSKYARPIARRGASGCQYMMGLQNAGATRNLRFFDGATDQAVSLALRNYTMLGITFVNGAPPVGYHDAASTVFGSNCAITVRNEALGLMRDPLGATNGMSTQVECILIFNTALTGAQISELYALWRAVAHSGRSAPKNPTFSLMPPPEDIAATLTENFPMEFNATGQIAGTEGVSTGGATNIVTHTQDGLIETGSIVGHNSGNSQLAFTAPASLLSASAGAIELIVTPRLATPAATEIVASSDGNTDTLIQQSTTGRWQFVKGNPAVTIQTAAGAAKPGTPTHLLGTWWNDAGTLRMEFFLNGISIGTNTFTDATVVSYLNVLSRLGVSAFDGACHLMRTYSTRVTPADARTLYLQYAVKPIILSPRFEYPVKFINVSAAGYLGPWLWGSGSLIYTDSGTRRQLVNVAGAGSWCSHPSKQAYGGWYFRVPNWSTGSFFRFGFGSARLGFNVVGQNGYSIYIINTGNVRFYIWTGAAFASVFGSAVTIVTGTSYEFFLARRYDSQFSLYIRGGVYSAWTLVGAAVDATHTTASFLIPQLWLAGDTITDVITFPLGGTIDPTAGDLDGILEAV